MHTGQTDSSFSIFYNIFIHEQAISRALGIVQEQISQIGDSNSRSLNPKVYYNTIGAPAVNTTWMDRICFTNGVICHHMNHYHEAQEELTLQAVYDYCQVHPEERVTYIHTKGSYHDKAWNRLPQDAWRRFATAAALTKDCIQPSNNTCNTCGLLFTIWPFMHFPGNFWTADCSYVTRLAPPKTFESQMQALYQERQQRISDKKQFGTLLFQDNNSTLGLGRMASEHWIASHPSIQPCDLSKTWDIRPWQTSKLNEADFSWSMIPRHQPTIRNSELRYNGKLRLKEYYLLAGNLFKWFRLYSSAPPASSWIWTWFPDGEKWRDAVQQYGNKAVDMITQEPVTVIEKANDHVLSIGSESPQDNGTTRVHFKGPRLDLKTSPPLAVFYNIYIPPDKGQSGFLNAWDIIAEQIAEIGRTRTSSGKRLTVFYNTIGAEGQHRAYMNLLCIEHKLSCVYLEHFAEGHEDKTLQSLKHEELRMREYFLLPGSLFQYFHLYNEAPPSSSWMWSRYPQGKPWKAYTEEYGANVVDVVTQKYVELS